MKPFVMHQQTGVEKKRVVKIQMGQATINPTLREHLARQVFCKIGVLGTHFQRDTGNQVVKNGDGLMAPRIKSHVQKTVQMGSGYISQTLKFHLRAK